MSVYAERIARVQEALRANQLGAAILAPSDQMRYLTGWAEHGHERLIAFFVPAAGEPAFIVPAMNAEQARENPAGTLEVFGWSDEEGWQGGMRSLLERSGLNGRGIAIDDEMQAVHLLEIQSLAPSAKCEAAGNLMSSLRAIKSADEIETMRHSGAITDSVYEESLTALTTGITELEFQEVIRQAYVKRGTKPEFALVCFGANSSRPHHSTGPTRLADGDVVVIDIGCKLEGYASDITRTVVFGEPEPEAKRVYDVVYRAHRAAFERIRPGVACEEVDRAARSVIEDEGYGEYFIHRTGHGIGLSTHEPPYIVAGNPQPLREGMCFSDEPGIYLPGRFGARIENIVTLTAGGAEYLNADPPNELLVIRNA